MKINNCYIKYASEVNFILEKQQLIIWSKINSGAKK